MKFKTETRLQILNKYNKKCAYCGTDLKYQNMQIDHIVPIYRKTSQEELNSYNIIKGTNDIHNLNPSCKSCNASKSTFSIEKWREEISLKVNRIRRDSSTFRILERYNLIKTNNNKVVFYYEKIK